LQYFRKEMAWYCSAQVELRNSRTETVWRCSAVVLYCRKGRLWVAEAAAERQILQ
jgi:hypothetical protein